VQTTSLVIRPAMALSDGLDTAQSRFDNSPRLQ